MQHFDLASAFTSLLGLEFPPVALAFVKSAPAGIKEFDSEVPSACSFWRRAESEVFYASAEKHFNCPIGAMTMGFDMPDTVKSQLGMFVEKMCDCNYMSSDEPANIPAISKEKNGIVYGPLRDFPIDPDLILMWLKPAQAMLYTEAVGTANWANDDSSSVFGRPACAALPVAFENNRSSSSLGCRGMRTFTEIEDDRMLTILPGQKVEEFLELLSTTVRSNQEMGEFYLSHKAKFAEMI